MSRFLDFYLKIMTDKNTWGIRFTLDIDNDFGRRISYDFTIQVLYFALVFGWNNEQRKKIKKKG